LDSRQQSAEDLIGHCANDMTEDLRILFLEDVASDAELAGREVQKIGINFVSKRVENRAQFIQALAEFQPDLILADFSLPQFDGLSALAIARAQRPDTPFIFVSGAMGEEFAIDTLKQGATDYVLKNNLKRLGPAVQRALKAQAERHELEVVEAQKALANERLGLALNASKIAVWDADMRTGGVYLSEQWAEMLGEEPRETITTIKEVLEIAHPDDHKSLRKLALDTIKGIRPSYDTEHRIRTRSGQWKWIHSRGHVAERDSEGKALRMIGTNADVSERKRAEQEALEQSKHYLANLESAMLGTVNAIARMLELRDPYTAGHQRRVAELAVAIGNELGLSAEQLKGLRVAGFVHDIGKISVAAEILSKPGKLSPVEFEIVKSHPQQGYEILKSVEFPWPVALGVLQHHERVDGSGYPSGLKDDRISIFARILAVADTVEAMASDRPYRPGRGIDDALKEIEDHLNTRYDNAAGTACLRLFREKKFVLPT
jgi:PAS domain S-box-containing protein